MLHHVGLEMCLCCPDGDSAIFGVKENVHVNFTSLSFSKEIPSFLLATKYCIYCSLSLTFCFPLVAFELV